MAAAIPRIDVTLQDLHALLAQLRPRLSDAEYDKLTAVIDTLGYVADLLDDHTTTLARLRGLLLGTPSTEKTHDVLAHAGVEATAPRSSRADDPSAGGSSQTARGRPRGHGRNGADAYAGADRIRVAHPQLTAGDRCPECQQGKVYRQPEPARLVRIIGRAPIAATVYELEKLRCNLCGEVFTADPPVGVSPEKYDATTGAMVALLKYGSGLPFYRLERLQATVAVPLPASTQWEIVRETAGRIQPALDELIRQAAQGEVLHNDDTSMTVLSLTGGGPDPAGPGEHDISPDRTGVFTSGIVATRDGHRLALFFTGRRHAGEHLAAVLARRAADLAPPIQMCDALARNLPRPLEVIVAHCLAHSRRRFVAVTPNFPAECQYVLETLRDVYRTDAEARKAGLSAEARLQLHQRQSSPLMEQLQTTVRAQLDDHRVEPNSGLGQAITYLLKYWTKLTLFLRQPGAPLDNNLCERALKKAILHRKNALFFKTWSGAHVGDLFMSLIHTCELEGVNPFDYLTALQRHAAQLATQPSSWLPWNYREALASVALESG
jgi:transposase